LKLLHEPTFVFGEAHRSIKRVCARPVIAARHLDSDAAATNKAIRGLIDEHTAYAKSARINVHDKSRDSTQAPWGVEKLVSMSAQAADDLTSSWRFNG
jgi:hypothetical protein